MIGAAAAGCAFLALLAGIVRGVRYLRGLAAVGAAYKAKVLCSAWFVSGRRIDPRRSPEVAGDSYRPLRLFRAEIDAERRCVDCSILGLGARAAIHRPGLGATLVPPRASRDRLRAGAAPISRLPGGDDSWLDPPAAPADLRRVLDRAFAEENPGRPRRTRAVIVVADGRLVAERYAPGFSRDTPLPGWSMTKAVTAALVGILVGEGRLALGSRDLLPEWSRPGDPRRAIALEDLLRMRSGLAWTEKYDDPFSDVNRMLWTVGDAAAYAAAKPAAAPPGSCWRYSSGTTNIVSRLLRRAVGERAYPAFPRAALFEPLGMSRALIEPDASGTFVGSSFMFATAREWARFGLLHARDGVWRGRRILPKGWVDFCRAPTPQSPGGCYGAHWWLKLPKELGGGSPAAERIPPDAYYALGHEGQSISIVPSRRLVAVRLGLSIYIDAWDHARFMADLLEAVAS